MSIRILIVVALGVIMGGCGESYSERCAQKDEGPSIIYRRDFLLHQTLVVKDCTKKEPTDGAH